MDKAPTARLLYHVDRPNDGECPGFPLQGSLTATNRRVAGVKKPYGWCWYNPVYPAASSDMTASELDEYLPYRAMSPLTMEDVGLDIRGTFAPLNDIVPKHNMGTKYPLGNQYHDPFPQALVLLLDTKNQSQLSFLPNPPVSVNNTKFNNTFPPSQFVGQSVELVSFSVLHVYRKMVEQMIHDEDFDGDFKEHRAPDGVAILPLLTKSGSEDPRHLAPPDGLVKVWELGTMDMASLEARELSLNQCVSLTRSVATPVPLADPTGRRQLGALEANYGVDCTLSTLDSYLALEVAVSGFTMCPLVINPVVTAATRETRGKQSSQDLLADNVQESVEGDFPFSLHSVIEAIDCKVLSSGLEEEFFQGAGGISLQSDSPEQYNKPNFKWGGTESAQTASQRFFDTMDLRTAAIHRTFPYAAHDGSFFQLNTKTAGSGDLIRKDAASSQTREAGSKVNVATFAGPRLFPAGEALPTLSDEQINVPPSADRYSEQGLARYGSRQSVVVPASRWQVWPHVVATVSGTVVNLIDMWDDVEVGVKRLEIGGVSLFETPQVGQAGAMQQKGNLVPRTLFTRPSQSSTPMSAACYRLHLHWDGTTAAPMGRAVQERLPQPLATDPFVARNTIVQQLASTVTLLNQLRKEGTPDPLEHVFSDIKGEIYACSDKWFQTHVKLYAMGDVAIGSTIDTGVFDTCYLRSGRIARKTKAEPLHQALTRELSDNLPAMYCGCMEYMPRGTGVPSPDACSSGDKDRDVDWEEPGMGNSDPWNWTINLECQSQDARHRVTVGPVPPPADTTAESGDGDEGGGGGEGAHSMQSCVLTSSDPANSWTLSVNLHDYQAPALTLSTGESTSVRSDVLFGLTTAVSALAGQCFDDMSLSLVVGCDPFPASPPNLVVGIDAREFRCHPVRPLRQLTPLFWTTDSAVVRMSIRAMDPSPKGSEARKALTDESLDQAFLPDLQFGIIRNNDVQESVHALPIMTEALTRGADTTQVHGMLVYMPVPWGNDNMLGTKGDLQKNTIVACRAAQPPQPVQQTGLRSSAGAAAPDDIVGQVAALTTGLLMIALAVGVG